jgi:hypothetical protein
MLRNIIFNKYILNKIVVINIILFASIILNNINAAYANGDSELKLFMLKEYANLPEYCQYRLTEIKYDDKFKDVNGKINFPPVFSQNLNKWKNRIGTQNWKYFHHYCTGIIDYNYYSNMSIDSKKRFKSHQLNKALGQFEFMRRAQLSNFPLWYDLYRYEALIYMELGNTGKAQWAIQQSQKYRKK